MPKKSTASRAQSKRWKTHRIAQSTARLTAINWTTSGTQSENPSSLESSNKIIEINLISDSEKGSSPLVESSRMFNNDQLESNSAHMSLHNPQPPHSSSDHPPPEPYWLPIALDDEQEEDDLDPLEMHLYAWRNIANSSDEEEVNPEFIKDIFYPVFTQKCPPEAILGKQRTKAGLIMKGYKKPQFQPGNAKGKPVIQSRQTKSSRKKKREAALGKKNLVMSNWMNQAKAPPPPSSTHSDNTPINVNNEDLQTNPVSQALL